MAIGSSLFNMSPDEKQRRLNQTAALGATAIRVDFNWRWIQPNGPDSYDWSEPDSTMVAARRSKLKVLALLLHTPPWAVQADCRVGGQCLPADPARLANFAIAVADRYPDLTRFEIGNEPNLTGQAEPVRYAAGYTAAQRALHARRPGVLVSLGGLAPSYSGGGNMGHVEFLARVYEAGARPDVVADHPYSYPALPSQQFDWSAFTQLETGGGACWRGLCTIHAVLAAHGDAGREIWLTEYGAPTGGSGLLATRENQQFGKSTNGYYVSEDLQAAMIWQFLRWRFVSLRVTQRYVYNLRDRQPTGASSDREDYFGLCYLDGREKPAAAAFRAAARR